VLPLKFTYVSEVALMVVCSRDVLILIIVLCCSHVIITIVVMLFTKEQWN